jgi:hypothetical protein
MERLILGDPTERREDVSLTTRPTRARVANIAPPDAGLALIGSPSRWRSFDFGRAVGLLAARHLHERENGLGFVGSHAPTGGSAARPNAKDSTQPSSASPGSANPETRPRIRARPSVRNGYAATHDVSSRTGRAQRSDYGRHHR